MSTRNFEIYPFRLWVYESGWRLTFCEMMNFNTQRSWAIFALGWKRVDGFTFEIGDMDP